MDANVACLLLSTGAKQAVVCAYVTAPLAGVHNSAINSVRKHLKKHIIAAYWTFFYKHNLRVLYGF